MKTKQKYKNNSTQRQGKREPKLGLRGKCKIEASNQIQQEFKDAARNVAVPLSVLGPDLISWQ